MTFARTAAGMIDADRWGELVTRGDWASVYAMLDDARDRATTKDEIGNEVHWRIAALEWQRRYDEALRLLKSNAHLYNAQCLLQHKAARLLWKLGCEKDALEELRKAPIEAEMTSFYALALDAKFFYLYLSARDGDPSVKDRLAEIPDDYEYFRRDGTILVKADIADAKKNRLRGGTD